MTNTPDDEYWMQQAIEAAKAGYKSNEVPVGAVLVIDNKCIATGHNAPISNIDPSAHAEMLVLRKAAASMSNYRLPNATLYVTLEPCMMCAGAMLHARIKRLVFGAHDQKTGAAGGRFDWLQDERHLHKIDVSGGVMQKPCAALLQEFFRNKRAVKNN